MKVYLVPDINNKDNVYLYCNYARRNWQKECCLNCENDCKHKGEHTVIDTIRRKYESYTR